MYLVAGFLTGLPVKLLFRLKASGTEHLPREGGYVLSANHLSNFDPWPLGLPMFPSRQIRFMAKSELFRSPLWPILRFGGAFKVRRGEGDTAAIATAVQLAKEGEVVAIFPEGTRRTKGLVKKHQARPHTGAARVALEAAVPLIPAAIAGTDRITRLGPLRVAYGPPVELDDLREHDDLREAAQIGTDRLMTAIGDAGEVAVKPLLVVDGDSLAHRAYHALPKTIKRAGGKQSGAIVGFTNFLVRLWEAEQPRSVVVGWDTLEVPTYRHEAYEPYQSGRVFDPPLLEQLGMLPELVQSFGFTAGKAPGYEADDFLAAAVAAAKKKRWPALVVTSDRDSFQLASEKVTILTPTRGVSELARIGPDEVRERYGVEPKQVPDFIALRGDPSDKLPGAPGVGPKRAAEVIREHGSLEKALKAGRFAPIAEELRLYRRIAALDASAPLPPLEDQFPLWAEASALLSRWGMNQMAERMAARAE